MFSIENDTEKSIYTAVVSPETAVNNAEMKVVAAKDGNARNEKFTASGFTKEQIEEKLALPENRPNATGGTFTSREIDLPKGVTSYKVRISLQNKHQAGMSYNSTYLQYSLPITGLDFNVDQDTSVIAKNLLSRIYDKLKATETEDTDGKTNDTKDAYLAELENIKTLITSTDVKKTPEYKQALESILSKHLALEVDKTGLTDSKTSLDDLVKEDPTPGKTQDTATAYNTAKQEAIKAIEAAKAVIANTDATVAQVREALATVNAKKTELEAKKQALVEAATTEEKAKLKTDADSLVKADTTGKTPNSIQAYNTKYEAIKAQLEAAKTEAATVLAKENNASKAEAQAAQEKVDAAKAELTKAAELLVNKADKTELTKAKEALSTLATEADPTTGKTADSAKAYNDAKTAAQEAIQEAETVIKDENATPAQVTEALNKVNEKKSALETAKQALVEAATAEEKAKLKADADLLTKADETGKTPESIAAYERKYEELKAQLEAAKSEAATVLAKGNNASKAEVQAAQTKVDAVKTKLESAKNLLVEAATAEEKAKLKADVDSLVKADETGKTADSIKAYEAEFEKLKAQLEAAKTEAAAVLAKGDNATKTEAQEAQAKVDAAKKALDKAAESLKDLDRDGAKKEIADAAKKATDAIEASTSLTPEQKAEEKAKVAKEAKEAKDAIDNATTEEGINSAKENGKLAIEKEAAITAIKAEQAAKEQEIDNNTKLSDEEKAAAKAEVVKAATEAVEAIKKADTKDAVEAAKTKGEAAIKAVNPVGKEKALDAIQKVAEEKIAEIDKNDKLSAEEKAAAKAEVAKAAIEAVTAIQEAETQEAVNAAQEKGETAIKAVNPIGKEKALEAIQTTTEAKLAEIDKNTNLSAEEKASAKAEVAKAAIEAVEAIQKAETQEAVNVAQAKGEAAIKAVNPLGKEQAKAAIDKALAEKEKAIDASTDLTDAEKEVAKKLARAEAETAKKAIDNATDSEAVENALRTFLYQIDQELLVYKRPELDFEALLQSSVTGVVRVELGKAISQADVLAKLNLPDEISVLSIELPDTNTVGTKYAKVTVQLADGTQRVIEVPIEVVAPQNQDNSPTHDGRDNGSSNDGEKVNKSKLDRAIHQLESFIKQSGEISKEANDLLSEAKKLFADPNASQAEVDAMVKRIEDFMLKGSLANNQASQVSAVIPARVDATVNQVADTNERKVTKELPNTGTTESVVAMIAAAASGLVGLGLAGRRKED